MYTKSTEQESTNRLQQVHSRKGGLSSQLTLILSPQKHTLRPPALKKSARLAWVDHVRARGERSAAQPGTSTPSAICLWQDESQRCCDKERCLALIGCLCDDDECRHNGFMPLVCAYMLRHTLGQWAKRGSLSSR